MNLNVLIVDDEPEVNEYIVLRIRMESPDFSIAIVENAFECLEYLESHHVDCILSDYQMPDMTGMELLKTLRSRGNTTPFIFMTAQGNEEVAREAFKNGAFDYFTKESGFAHFAKITNSIEQAVSSHYAEQSKFMAETALLEEKNKLEMILASIGDCITIQDTDFRITFQNKAHKELLGEHVGEFCYKAFGGNDAVCPGCHVAVCFEDGSVHTSTKTQITKKGKAFIEIKAAALKDLSGNIIGCIESVRDITERKRIEEALATSISRQKAILNNIPHMAWLKDMSGRYIAVNEPLASAFGVRPEDLIGKTEYDLMDREVAAQCEVSDRLAIESGRRTSFEESIKTKDGEAGILEAIKTPVFDAEDNVIGIAGIARDITEKKKAEESLLLFRNLLDRSNDAIFVNDPATGRFLMVNDKACSSLGYDRIELLGMRVLDIEEMLPDSAAWVAHVDELKRKGYLITEGFHRKRDGSTFPVEVNVSYLKLGDRDYMVAVARDITERKQAEQALAEKDVFLESVFASIQDEITVLDMDQNIIRYNPTIGRRYAESMPLIGKKCYTAFLGRTEVCEGCPSIKTIKDGKTAQAEVAAKDAAGELCAWVDIHAFPLVDANTGKITGVIEHVRDITDRKLLERRTADFYAMLTHDLTSPLTALLGYAEILKSSNVCRADKDAGELAALIQKNGNKLRKLMDDYLEVSRIGFGNITLDTVTQNIMEILKEAAEEIRVLMESKKIEFYLNAAEDLPKVKIDKKYVLRAVTNLLHNAVKYTPRGGRISLGARTNWGFGCEFMVLEVSDTGPGVAAEEREKIFEKYYRSEKDRRTKGTGLGLYIVKTVAEAHGGKVEIDSEPGKGSTFRLFLPVKASIQ